VIQATRFHFRLSISSHCNSIVLIEKWGAVLCALIATCKPARALATATEADLCAAQKTDPSKTLELENMIAYMKASNVPQPEPGPLRVEIVNASEMAQKDQVIRIERDPAGQMTHAVAHKV
jgi:hypothetical protein